MHGHSTLKELEQQVLSTSSRYRQGPLEGLVIRRESADTHEARAKLVRPDFPGHRRILRSRPRE